VENVNRHDVATKLADKLAVTKSVASQVVDAMLEIVREEIVKGNRVNFHAFGTFEVKERAARMGINPKTKEKIPISAKKSLRFKVAKTIKDLLNGKK
jgi:DNA-binding protein HU-beta